MTKKSHKYYATRSYICNKSQIDRWLEQYREVTPRQKRVLTYFDNEIAGNRVAALLFSDGSYTVKITPEECDFLVSTAKEARDQSFNYVMTVPDWMYEHNDDCPCEPCMLTWLKEEDLIL